MAIVSIAGDELVFSVGHSIICESIGKNQKCQLLKCGKRREKQKETSEEDGTAQNKPLDGPEEGSDRILSCALSPSGKYLVACDDYKQICVWSRTQHQEDDESPWTLLSKRELGRRSTSLVFPRHENTVLVADKSGDVFSFSLTSVHSDGQLLLGHVSMILDVVLCGPSDNFIVTSDRDEKVRVSHFPNAYNIESYCLGHTDFVSCLAYFREEDLLISGGGDACIKIWDYRNGKALFSLDLTEDKDVKSEFETSEENSHKDEDVKEDGESAMKGSDAESGDLGETAIMSRTKGMADVKCLTCCQKNKYLAVAFDKLALVILYKLHTTPSGNQPELVKSQTLHLNSSGQRLMDIKFDQRGHLWYLEATRGDVLHIMVYDHARDRYVVLEECSDVETETKAQLQSVVKRVNAMETQTFDSCFVEDNSFELLHKVRIDNLTGYLERKQQRMEQKIQKRTSKTTDDQETKKLKT